ncbi:hypothetical protein R1flu_005525 [Riccia fluitans]|uniref:Uncharacterized protein n=1 Tax=Riccia fluitans TaxID=41844 RepID=A0ABD1YTE8_9MARC
MPSSWVLLAKGIVRTIIETLHVYTEALERQRRQQNTRESASKFRQLGNTWSIILDHFFTSENNYARWVCTFELSRDHCPMSKLLA